MASRIPTKDGEFDSYIRDSTEHLLDGTSPEHWDRLGLSSDEMDAWEAFKDAWIVLYPKYTNTATRSRSITTQKNNMKTNFRNLANPHTTF